MVKEIQQKLKKMWAENKYTYINKYSHINKYIRKNIQDFYHTINKYFLFLCENFLLRYFL